MGAETDLTGTQPRSKSFIPFLSTSVHIGFVRLLVRSSATR